MDVVVPGPSNTHLLIHPNSKNIISTALDTTNSTIETVSTHDTGATSKETSKPIIQMLDDSHIFTEFHS